MDKPKIGLCKPEYLIDCIEISIIVHPQDCFSQRVPVNKFDYPKIIIKGIKEDGSKSKENHPFCIRRNLPEKDAVDFKLLFSCSFTQPPVCNNADHHRQQRSGSGCQSHWKQRIREEF